MDKGLGNNDQPISISSSSATITNNSSSNTNNNRDMFLKQLNKNSHKIAKPLRKPLPPPPPTAFPIADPNPLNPGQASSQQPPVYNINKNDFRDVVQKLTGSPAHDRLPTPPPVTQPRPPSSRLQRIRPPPLAQISNRPPPLAQISGGRPQNDAVAQPFPPLPPLPSVHPAAESPISAYMRFLQSSAAHGGAPTGHRPKSLLPPPNELGQRPPFSSAESPISAYMRFLQSSAGSSSVPPPPSQPLPFGTHQQPFSSAFFPSSPFPVSPLPFGCVPSPRSPYGMMSPTGFLFSPTGQLGLPQLPLSPTLPVPSPRWKGM